MEKILIIGQSLPKKTQSLPYDTTLLYTMLEWVNITKERAQMIFDFDALSDTFLGLNKQKGHQRPLKANIAAHEPVLIHKIDNCSRIILLGRMACDEYAINSNFFEISVCRINTKKECLCLPHPSRRNYNLIIPNKNKITSLLNDFFN